jgi:hypothetical protein
VRSLLRKDAAWLIGFALGGLLVELALQIDLGAEVWIRPEDHFARRALLFFWIGATPLGLWAGLYEDFARTREYLLHRPVSHRRLFWTRQLGCALVMASWILLVPLLHLAVTTSDRADGALVDRSRLLLFFADGVPAVIFQAQAVFFATLVRRPVLAVPLALAGGLMMMAVFGAAQGAGVPWPVLSSPVAAAATALVLALALLMCAERQERQGRDADRPWSTARLARSGPALVVLVTLGVALLFRLTQYSAASGLTHLYPEMALAPDGQPFLLRRLSGNVAVRVDAQHRTVPGPVSVGLILYRPTTILRPERDADWTLETAPSIGERGERFRGVRYQHVSCFLGREQEARCYVGSDGRVHLLRYQERPDQQGPFYFEHITKEGGRLFSPRAQVLGGSWGKVALIGDPEDGSVWAYDPEIDTGGFRRVELPGGDRFVRHVRAGAAIQGARGFYVVTPQGRAEPAPPRLAKQLEGAGPRPAQRGAQVQPLGVLRFAVSLPSARGFRHEYRPYRLAEKAALLWVTAPSLLRSPALGLLSRFTEEGTDPARADNAGLAVFLDPVVRLSAPLLALNALVALALAALTLRRLHRLRVPMTRRLLWTGTVLLAGAAGYACARAVETNRAWTASGATPEPEVTTAARLLIQTT